jgi:hypothetical protein
MDYSEVLSRAWQTIWKHKLLWIFGILSGCSNSGGGFGNYNYTYRQNTPESVQRFFENIPQSTLILLIVAAIVIILVLVVISIFLGTIGKIGLVRGTQLADRDMEAKLGFGELFKGSLPYFWRAFLLSLLVGIAIALIIASLVVVGIGAALLTLGIALICILPLICLLIPVGIIVNLVVEQSIIAIVTEDLDVFAGLRRGWEVVRGNAGSFALMWLILGLAIRGIGGLILGIPMLVVAIPLIAAAISRSDQALIQGLVISAICFVGYLPFLILFNGILNSYVQSGWTLTFLRLTKPGMIEPEPLPEAAG